MKKFFERHPKAKAFLLSSTSEDEDREEGIRDFRTGWLEMGQVVYNAMTRYVLTAIVLVFMMIIARLVLTPPGLPGLVANIMVTTCKSTGQCDYNTLLIGVAVSVILGCYIAIPLLFSVNDPLEAKHAQYQMVDETHANLLLIDDQIDALQEQVRMLQWQLIVKPALDSEPGAIISLKTGEVLGIRNMAEDGTPEEEEEMACLAEGESIPWKHPDIIKRFGENLNQNGK